jgi:hypothetical protein
MWRTRATSSSTSGTPRSPSERPKGRAGRASACQVSGQADPKKRQHSSVQLATMLLRHSLFLGEQQVMAADCSAAGVKATPTESMEGVHTQLCRGAFASCRLNMGHSGSRKQSSSWRTLDLSTVFLKVMRVALPWSCCLGPGKHCKAGLHCVVPRELTVILQAASASIEGHAHKRANFKMSADSRQPAPCPVLRTDVKSFQCEWELTSSKATTLDGHTRKILQPGRSCVLPAAWLCNRIAILYVF